MSAVFGLCFAVLSAYDQVQAYAQPLGPTSDPASYWLVTTLSVLVTPLAFYWLGRKLPEGFSIGKGVLGVYFGSVLGEILGQATAYPILAGSQLSPFLPVLYFSVVAGGLEGGLSFLFVAFTGIALARLSQSGPDLQGGGDGKVLGITVVALAFGLFSSLISGMYMLWLPQYILSGRWSPGLFAVLSAVGALVAFPGALLAFYGVGKITVVRGKTFTCFGLLFLGLYAGSMVGVVISLALFGHSQWAIPAGETTGTGLWGLELRNVPPSMRFVLENLDPVGHLPFLQFFALSLPHLRQRLEAPMVVGVESGSLG